MQQCVTRVRLPWSPPSSKQHTGSGSSAGRAPDRKSGRRWFKSDPFHQSSNSIFNTALAQLEERCATNAEAAGSNPVGGTNNVKRSSYETETQDSKTHGGVAQLAEHSAFTRLVVDSNSTAPTIKIFHQRSQTVNADESFQYPDRPAARSAPFQGDETGSIPVLGTN